MDEYHISDLPQRFIMTQHYQSSLNQPNLENVQAKLNVARQRNHDLALQYFRNKYGSTEAYNQFTKHHNMGEFKPVYNPSPQQLLKDHLSKKARQIQKRFYNEDNLPQQQQDHQDGKQPEWARKVKKKANNNPWHKQKQIQKSKKKQVPQTAYVDSAVAPKNKQSEFISQFKSYLQNKQKFKEQHKKPIEDNQNLFNKSTNSKFQQSKIINKSTILQPQQGKKRRCYEQQLAKKIYKQISGQSKDNTQIQKLQLFQYLIHNNKIMKVLGITQQQLNQKLMKQQLTKKQSIISLQQFTYFILKLVGKEKQINELKQQKRDKQIPEGCMLTKQLIVHFQKVFKQSDVHTDLIIKRLAYIDRLANDPLVRGYLNAPAVYEAQMQKTVTLRRIFERIQMECLFVGAEQQKAKQYISWNQFIDYFKAGASNPVVYNIISAVESLHKSQVLGLAEVPDSVIKLISQTASKLPTKSGYFNIANLIQAIRKHPDFESQKYTLVRQQSKLTDLPAQGLQEVLIRIKQKGANFMNLKQFMEYFSNKGRPVQQFQEAKNNIHKKNFSGVKIKFAENQVTYKNQNLDGYDSDPQMYQSKILVKNSPRKSGRSAKKFVQSSSFIQQEKSKPLNKKQYKVTIPVPFSFQERQKQLQKKKLQKSMSQQQTELKVFKAKPIPPKVLQQGLYEKMLEQDRKKIQQRRKSCMIMTLANQRPFSFIDRKTNKKNKVERKKFVFKANPIPWYCSVDLLQKKKQAQIVRNQKIAKEAQQNLAKAKLPPRMERDFQQKQAKIALAAQQQKIKRNESKSKNYRQPPDFDKLHREFQEGLERKRKQNKATVPKQFNFTQKSMSRPQTAFPSHKTQLQFDVAKKQQDYKKILSSKPAAASTAKFQQQVEKRRLQMQKKRKQQQKKKIQEENRLKIDENLKNKLIAATKLKQQQEKNEKQQRNKQMEKQAKDFKDWKKNCIDKGRNQPMLVERPLKRDEKIQKMKKLYHISQTLKQNGIKGKDHDTYFNRQQLLMLQDWEVLKQKIA